MSSFNQEMLLLMLLTCQFDDVIGMLLNCFNSFPAMTFLFAKMSSLTTSVAKLKDVCCTGVKF